MNDFKIEKFIEDDEYTNCLWNNGLLATIQTKKGTYCVIANGDVKCNLKANTYFSINDKETKKGEIITHISGDGHSFYKKMRSYIIDDEDLDKILNGKHPLYELEFEHNNWYELDFLNKDGEYEGLDIVLDSNLLDDAIKETIKMIPDLEEEKELI